MKGGIIKVGEYEVCIRFYLRNVVVVIHHTIPGVGSVVYMEKDGAKVDCDQLLGPENQMLTLLATILAGNFDCPCATFIFSFHPNKMRDFDEVKHFAADFVKVLNEFLPA
jgi:hypothetical protein